MKQIKESGLLAVLNEANLFFVTRSKKNMQYVSINKNNQLQKHILKDKTIE